MARNIRKKNAAGDRPKRVVDGKTVLSIGDLTKLKMQFRFIDKEKIFQLLWWLISLL
ncbi:MAG: hypothetical protein GY801_08905 [bacterium]|nr:hypothetical protein [bacterium]